MLELLGGLLSVTFDVFLQASLTPWHLWLDCDLIGFAF